VKESGAALLIGGACGVVVGLIVLVWRGTALPALVIGLSISLALFMACVVGLSVPALLHSLKLDPKIAAGPIALAITDVFTLLFYFGLARLLL
jgi:magnesium transporter